MLIVYLDILHAVNALNLSDNIIIYGGKPVDSRDIGRTHITLGEYIAAVYIRTVLDKNLNAVRNRIYYVLTCLGGRNNDISRALCIDKMSNAGNLGNGSRLFRFARLKDLRNSRQTLCDIASRDTARMESTHRKLCTGFADRLSRDYADSFAYAHGLACCKVGTIAMSTYAVLAFTLEYGADINLCYACIHDALRLLKREHVTVVSKHLAGLRIYDIIYDKSAGKPVYERLDNLVTVAHYICHPDTLCSAAVLFSYDDILRYVNETSCKVTGVCRFQSRIGKRFTRASRTGEVLENIHAFAEVALDRDFHCASRSREHQTAHTCELTHLAHGATGSRIAHHVDRIVSVKTVLKRIRNILCCLLPYVYDALVTFILGEKSSTEVALDMIHFLLRFRNESFLLGRNRHIRNRYGD